MPVVGLSFVYDWWPFPVALLVAWSAMLRVAELLTLTPMQLSQKTAEGWVVLTLTDTKTSSRNGRSEQAAVTDSLIAKLLLAASAGRRPTDRIFPFSYHEFLSKLHQLTSALSMNHLNFSTHSLRRGGATDAFKATGSFDTVAELGRWRSIRACRQYVKTALAEVSNHHHSQETASMHAHALEILFQLRSI